MMSQVLAPHDLRPIDPTSRIDARLHCRRLFNTTINFITYGADVMVALRSFETFFGVAVSLGGTIGFRRGTTRFLLTKDLGAVVSPTDNDLTMYWQRSSAQLGLRIEQPALEAQLSSLLGEHLPRPLQFDNAIPLNRGSGKNLSTKIRLLAHHVDRIDHRRSIYDHQLTADAFEQSLMTELLFAQRHNYTTALAGDVNPTGSRDVRHAVALLESHPEWQLSLTSVANTLNVSARSLQRGFQRELGTTFRAVLHSIRLRRLHDDLVHSDPDTAMVNDMFARWGLPVEGYTFSAYHRQFGETPAETLGTTRTRRASTRS